MGGVTHLLPAGAELADARATLAATLNVRPGPTTRITATYYDTFDGRLHGAGLTLRAAGGRIALLDRETGDEVASGDGRATAKLLDEDLPEPLRERLADVIEMRALLPVARLRSQRLLLAVLNNDAKTVVRLSVELHEGLHGRVSASAVRGYDGDLARVETILAQELALPTATVALVDEAIAAAGGNPAGTSAKLDLALQGEQPANEAAQQVFARLLEVIDENVPGTLDDIDSEFLHDLRVAVRRTRSLQRQFKAIYPDRLQHFRDEFKRLQNITGDLRDLDVYLLDFDDLKASLPERIQADLDPLREILITRRARALTATRRGLKAQRSRDALREWADFVASAPTAEKTVEKLATHRIRAVHKQMVKMGKGIDDGSPAEDLHELRKVGKELRYLLEFFQSLYEPDVVKPFIKTLKGLQDMLGRFQDREVQANWLRDLAPDVKEPFTLMAMGVLVDRFMKEEADARAEFAERFGAFASEEHFGVSRVLATYNIKGGVGKTSAAVNLATLAAHGGDPTLLWDLDPQGASTFLFRVKPKIKGGGDKLVRGKTEADGQIKGTDTELLDLLPADFSYRHMDLALDGAKTNRLTRVLKPLDYEYVFLDCPPSISLVSENVFEAADVLIVPIIPATLSSRTLEQLHQVLSGNTKVLGFFSMADRRKKLHRELMASLAAEYDLLETVIPASADVERMGAERAALVDFAPRSRAAVAYSDLWEEIRKRIT